MCALAADLEELLERIAAREPEICALLPEEGRAVRLRREAETLLERYPRPQERPPLFGAPVGIKDVFRVDGFATRAGSRLPAEEFAGAEAESVTLLKRAGALILGKTVSTEFAYFAPGPTRNPRAPEHTPGGSSSGSAAAVAAGYCPLALGTQTVGSTLRPAAYCGVVGWKPTQGRIATAGLVPLAPSADQVGLFTTDVAGAARASAVLCAGWRSAGAAAEPLVAAGRRLRLAIPEGPYLERASAEGLAHFDAAVARLAATGCAVERIAAMPDFAAIASRHWALVAAEAAQVHAGWLERHRPLYSAAMIELIERGQRVGPDELAQARAGCRALRHELEGLLDRHRLDLFLSPAAPGPAPRGLGATGDPVMNIPWTHAGLPALSLPAGTTAARLPLGLQVAGRAGADEELLAAATDLERALAA